MSANTFEAGVGESGVVFSATILGPVAKALSEAVAGAGSWMTPADAGAIAGLEVLADAIDAMSARGEPDFDELGKMVSRFLVGLGVAGLTPAGRGRLDVESEVPNAGAELVALVGGRAG
jgi:hypothetical protein